MSELRFDGKVAVITGAGAGLGKEYALLFASRGAKVVVNDLGGGSNGVGKSQKAADIVVDEIKAKGGIAVADYNSVVDGEKIIKTALDAFGRIDILVNNAGILRDRSFPRISEQDWDIIQDVHLKGSFKTTQAAWPIFKKQNFGRIIMTSSNSGIIGNFGQANYGAAKMALVGLANTLAIEGAKNNIHCNVIVPSAASRLTQGIIPEAAMNEFRPELIAPVVVYLCHESNKENGAYIESAAGWATKLYLIRGKGALLRKTIDDAVTPEYVRQEWKNIIDMSKATHLSKASGSTVKMIKKLINESENQMPTDFFNYTHKDLILYALGVGATVQDKTDLKFLFEKNDDFIGLPTFFIQPSLLLSMRSGGIKNLTNIRNVNRFNILHGEQYLEIVNDLPISGTLNTTNTAVEALDKKSGVLVVSDYESCDENGTVMVKTQLGMFCVGANIPGGKTKSNKIVPSIPAPDRSPDSTSVYKTSLDQGGIYRLSGDYNPIHIDPNAASIGGFKTPILHGLCTLGISVRLILKKYANNDPRLFKAVKVRFVKPVLPGETLKVDMWQNGNRIHFITSVAESNTVVLSGAYVDLKMVKVNLTSANTLQSDAVFGKIKDKISEDPAKAKSINAIILFKITESGKVVKEWTLDLKNGNLVEGTIDNVKIDTTLTVADSDMLDIALGKLNAQAAFMKGKLKITGNIMLTQKLTPFLKAEAKL